MKIGKVAHFTVLAAGIVAANLSVFAGSALAGDRHYGRYNGNGQGHAPVRQYQAAPHYGHGGHNYGYHKKRNNHGAGIALGIGALILGTMIAAEAGRHHRNNHWED